MADETDKQKRELVKRLNSTQKLHTRMLRTDISNQSSQLKDRLRERQMSKDRGVSFKSQNSFMSMIGTSESGEQISSIMDSSNMLDTLSQSAVCSGAYSTQQHI